MKRTLLVVGIGCLVFVLVIACIGGVVFFFFSDSFLNIDGNLYTDNDDYSYYGDNDAQDGQGSQPPT
ncbi:MAG TPA: hypothetical protein VJ965_03395, partial [Anaerolineales bacterium]|nr:hypothetical protein [Anaerolineales bacterium]